MKTIRNDDGIFVELSKNQIKFESKEAEIIFDLSLENDFLEQENKKLKTLLKGTTHCYDEVEHKQLMEENKELKKQLDYALKLLAEMFLPCERDDFMYKYSDYCQSNCGVDEEVFKKCWLMYIKDKLKEDETDE